MQTLKTVTTQAMSKIQACLQEKQFIFQHILREGNKLAHHFANIAIDKENYTFTSFNSMETEGRRIINNDKLLCIQQKGLKWGSGVRNRTIKPGGMPATLLKGGGVELSLHFVT
ncbi:hypothetical protein H5410_048832 [Solanum commersonii]|uniref:Uncharacterized protein n=1 Tax=Solanum commersonii TaxID=4109 RepID=A0A9J5XMX0_SOLCO|nr:hypothetical protein H5410_048832 [Solanum commersonii]